MSDLINNSAPGVYSFTRVQAQAVAAATPSVVGVVFESEKGPVGEPVLITGGSREKFIQLYGKPLPAVSNAHEAILEVLRANASVYALRVDNGSDYSGLSIYSSSDFNEGLTVNASGAPAVRNFFPQSTFFVPEGTENGVLFDNGREVAILEVKGVKADGGADEVLEISYVVGGGDPDVTVGVAYITSFALTVAAFVTALDTSLDGLDVEATLLSITNDVAYIRVRGEQGVTLPPFFNFTNTMTESAANYTRIHAQPKFFDVYAVSPGVWGNRVGIRIRNVDYGRQATKAIDFVTIPTTQSLTFVVDGITVGPVAMTGTRNVQLGAIVTALKTALDSHNISIKVGEQSWETALGASPVAATVNDDTIYIRHREFGSELTLTVSAVVTSGGAAATFPGAIREVVAPEPYTGLFTLEVFLKDDPSAPVETFRATLHEAVNDFGEQTNISYLVNEGPAQSAYIRVRQPEYTLYAATDNSHLIHMKGFFADDARTAYHVNASIEYLGGGSAGAAATTQDFLAGFEKFRDRDRYPVSLLMNAGYTNRDIQKKMLEICEARRDCFAVLDMPSAVQEVNRAKEYVDYELGANTSFGSIYTPDIRVVSEYSPGGRFMPPSGDVCARIVERQRQITNVGAPAGYDYGAIPRATKARFDYNIGDVGALQESNINPIIQKIGRGYNIWSARTLARKFGPLSFNSIRLDLNQIERQMVSVLDFAVFRANSVPNRFALKQQIDSLLTSYRRSGVIDFHEVTIDSRNNKDYHAANGQLNIDVILRFVYPAEKIRLVTTVTDTIITFSELQAAA
jgi:phage tail sheath protein FI